MNCSLYDSFLIALPHLPTELISKDRLPWIIDLVRRLPPVHAGGFECRLGAGNPRVDFQQRILAINDEPRILKNHIAGSMLGSSEVWRRIGQFCEQWMKPMTQLHRSVICVYGDGGMMMHLYVLEMAREMDLPVTFVVMNNSCLGNVRDFQPPERRIATDYPTANFARIAEGFGIHSSRVEDPGDFVESVAYLKNMDRNKGNGLYVLP